MANVLPAIFFGHGNPMNAVSNNGYTEAWQRMGQETPRPKAILSISAHWFVPHTGVTVSTAPRTIHDFGGFQRARDHNRRSFRVRCRAQQCRLLADHDANRCWAQMSTSKGQAELLHTILIRRYP
jgi:hypothetical protein